LEPAVDLRSDTVTRPTPAMRHAMAAAVVGDDVLGDDPTVRALEDEAARRTGKEAALFVPSGCMANLIALMIWVRRGDEVLVGQDCHIVLHEVGSAAAVAGVQVQVVPGNGLLTPGDLEARIKRPTFHTPGTGLVCIENTHNMAGGAPYELAEVRAIGEACRRHGLPLHVDGARIFNAAAALGVDLRDLASPADSLSFCLSKGLGAPVGSVLCGTATFRKEAHRFRKMLGGGLRQAGVLAAAGLHALAHHVDRLAEDHALARRLAATLAGHPKIDLDPGSVRTNIVMARLHGVDAEDLVARCAARGVLFLPRDRQRIRLVTHLDVRAADVDRAAGIVLDELR
jgi:threonine aldolase